MANLQDQNGCFTQMISFVYDAKMGMFFYTNSMYIEFDPRNRDCILWHAYRQP